MNAPTRPMRDVLFGAFSRRLAPLVLAGALLMPPGGLGLDLCWFHANTGLPCPGCGLTRSLASLAHLDLGRAIELHPFGPPIFAILVILGLSNLLGARRRERLLVALDRHDRALRLGYRASVLAFVAFGLVRLGVAIAWPEALTASLFTPDPSGALPWP